MEINGRDYALNQCEDLLEWCDNAKVGEYTNYFDKYVYKNENGVFACYVDDTKNMWQI